MDLLGAALAFFGILVPSAALALPALGDRSRYLETFGLVTLPLVLFLADVWIGTPIWKGACKCGWADGFHESKLALLPLLLLAFYSLYAAPRWRIAGLWCGSITFALISLFAIVCMSPWGVALAYIPVWYGYRAWQLQPTPPTLHQLLATPFWGIATYWARTVFEQLPDEPQNCFVVNAAARGHRAVVGPFVRMEHNGSLREANAQLIALWRFESHWRQRFPLSHAAFRIIYNRIGPFAAARITSPWIADLVYFALKPLQWIACAVASGE